MFTIYIDKTKQKVAKSSYINLIFIVKKFLQCFANWIPCVGHKQAMVVTNRKTFTCVLEHVIEVEKYWLRIPGNCSLRERQ